MSLPGCVQSIKCIVVRLICLTGHTDFTLQPMKISNKQSAPIGSSSGGLSKRLYADEEAAADDDSGDERTVERRYHALYEQKMNPFAEVCTCRVLLPHMSTSVLTKQL